jgi:hypothetical protein
MNGSTLTLGLIKSVDNRGTFDPVDPRISYNRSPQ